MALVLRLLSGALSVDEAAERYGLPGADVEEWRDRALLAAENALRSRPRDEAALMKLQIRQMKQKIGELVLEIDALKTAAAPEVPPSASPR